MQTQNATFTTSEVDAEGLQNSSRSILKLLIAKLTALFVRSQLEQAQAHYHLKRQRQASTGQFKADIDQLSISQKHQMGLYHLID